MRRLIFIWVIIFFIVRISSAEVTIIPTYSEQFYSKNIRSILQRLDPSLSVQQKIALLSAAFLDAPYVLYALGEGPTGKFDKSPLYRTDAFDCVTFVSTILALAYAHNEQEFLYHLKHIQYQNAKVNFINRFHFVELDWNKNNIRQQYLTDITQQICPHCLVATAVIDKSGWYQHLTPERLKLFKAIDQPSEFKLLTELQHLGVTEGISICRTYYIPLTELFTKEFHQLVPNTKMFTKIPASSVIEIVDKTNCPLVGTDSNIVHLGFAIKDSQGRLLLRHASDCHQKVTDVPLQQYLARYYTHVENPKKVGIVVMAIALRFAKLN